MTPGLGPPQVVQRDARPCLGIHATVTMANIDKVIQDLVPQLLGRPDVAVMATGAVFVRYDVIDMARELAIQVGVPVDTTVGAAMPGDGSVVPGVLPAGRYLSATHTGPYDLLEGATGRFLDWAAEHGYVFDVRPGDRGEVWGCRLEHYLTDPAQEPDPSRWQTVLEFRLRA